MLSVTTSSLCCRLTVKFAIGALRDRYWDEDESTSPTSPTPDITDTPDYLSDPERNKR